ncbi:MAG: putative toxin-antitoxin system toxin component, PIN family [bacterium]
MRVVIDTNIIVSGLLTPFGHCAEILRLLTTGKLIIYLDTRILVEYFKVLNRPKFSFNKDYVSMLIKEIELTGELITGIPLKDSLPDPDDNMFLEVALASNADGIITGNVKHFPQELCGNIRIFSPAGFLTCYKQKNL